MSILLWIDNALSAPLLLVCWWLAHQNAATDREPYGRTIAAGYSVLGFCVLANALLRNMEVFTSLLPLSLVISKAAMVFTLAAVSVRLQILHSSRL